MQNNFPNSLVGGLKFNQNNYYYNFRLPYYAICNESTHITLVSNDCLILSQSFHKKGLSYIMGVTAGKENKGGFLC